MMFTQNQTNWTGDDEKPSIVCYSSLILVLFIFKNVGQLSTFRWVIGLWIFFENEENQ